MVAGIQIDMGRVLVGAGLLLVLVGLAVIGFTRLGLPLGRLPGDLAYRGRNFSVFAPIGTSILLSVLLTLVVWLISVFRR